MRNALWRLWKQTPLARTGTTVDAGPWYCGQTTRMSVPEMPGYQDWSVLPTTPDQAAIEEALEAMDLTGLALLHVGVGNSSLARRFAGRCARIDGVTVSPPERRLGESLDLPGYRVMVANKHDPAFPRMVEGPYDLIVDNNPNTFCCCRAHMHAMWRSYRALLAPRGRMLTHLLGLGWTAENNADLWGLSLPDLKRIAAIHGLQVLDRSGDVIVIGHG